MVGTAFWGVPNVKILMVCEFFDEGLDYQENFLARTYHRLGHEVVIVTSTAGSVFDYTVDRSGAQVGHGETRTEYARIIRLPWRVNILHKIKVFGGLAGLVEREAPDLVYIHDIMPDMLDALPYVRRNPHVRMIMDYHSDLTNSGVNLLSRMVLHGVIRKAILDRCRPHLSKIFPIVPASTDFLRTYYGIPDSEMELLPLGVDLNLSRTTRAGDARGRVRDGLGIPEGALVVFTGGKMGWVKRSEEVLHAMRRLKDPDVHLIVVGKVGGLGADEAYAAMMEEAASGLANVHFVGWQDRQGVYDHMAAADLAVYPASQSVLWQQSLGMGLPLVVGERGPGMKVRQDVSYMSGLGAVTVLDDQGDVAAQIADVVAGFRHDPVALARAQRAALDTAETVLDYERIAAQTLRFNAAG